MYQRYRNVYRASEFAEFLKRKLFGDNCVICEPHSVNSVKDKSIIFIDNLSCRDFQYEKLAKFSDVLIITNEDLTNKSKCSFIVTPTPKLDFIRILHHFFVSKIPVAVHPTAIIDENAVIGKNVSIGAHAVIGSEVTIGDNTLIQQNVVMIGRVVIGNDCVIKPNTTIGSEGFNFVLNEEDHLEHFPHIGGIIIGNDVWIGANATIERATLDDTIIEDGVKVDDLVQIGHNTRIGESTRITAGAVICGRAVVGKKCWIAPNACIGNAVVVGDNALVGMGAVVLKDVPEGMVVAGVPARPLRKIKAKERP